MATAGTNITSIAKPGIGTTTGPQWATDLNSSLDAVDDHDHSTNKGIRITPAAVNINADLEYNQNSATELKNVIFDSSVTAATTSYSVYQASGNLYWRNGSGTAVQITTGSAVNAGAGSISGMSGTDAGVSYADGSKTFNFFTDSGNEDYGKMAHADLLLFKYTNDNVADTDYVTIAANAGVSGSSGTIYVPSENGTFLTTATSYATSAINIATSASNYPINLKPHGTGHVVVGNGGATGKLTSNGAYDLVIDTNSGTNAGNITLTDGTDGAITVTPNGSGVFTIGGAWTAASQTCANLGTVTTADINGGTWQGTIDGSWTAASQTCANLGTVTTADINGGTLGGITIDGNWTAASQTCANLGSVTTADINGGTIDGVTSFNGTVIITSATNNLGIGVDVLNTIGTGDYNVAFGDRALYDLDTGINNTAIGYNAAQNTEADENTVVGYQALNTNISGDANVAVGSNSLHLCSTGEFNVALGTGALYNTTGSNNTAIGRQAGLNITSGSNNICIGEDCRVTTATASNQLNIGDTIYADLSTGDIWTTTTGKIKQKGAFMQSSTHQALTLGY